MANMWITESEFQDLLDDHGFTDKAGRICNLLNEIGVQIGDPEEIAKKQPRLAPQRGPLSRKPL